MGHWVDRAYGSPYGTRYNREWEGDYSNYPSGRNPPIPGDYGYAQYQRSNPQLSLGYRGYTPPGQGLSGLSTPGLGNTGYIPSGRGSGYIPTSEYKERPLAILGDYILLFIVWLVIIAIAVGSLLGLYMLVRNHVPKDTFSTSSTWQGYEFQYAVNTSHVAMTLTIHPNKGTFYGELNWLVDHTITRVEGTFIKAVVNSKDARWKQVAPCNGIYLQFTETKFIQGGGNGDILNVKYYACAYDGNLTGFWFYPGTNDTPDGEFYLYLKST